MDIEDIKKGLKKYAESMVTTLECNTLTIRIECNKDRDSYIVYLDKYKI